MENEEQESFASTRDVIIRSYEWVAVEDFRATHKYASCSINVMNLQVRPAAQIDTSCGPVQLPAL